MEKRQFIEAAQRYLGGGNSPPDIRKKYPLDIIEKYLGMAFELYVNEIFASDPSPNKSFLDSLVKSYPIVTISTDAARSQKYCVIPTAKLFPLPDNKAIRHISVVTDQDHPFLPRQNNSAWVFSQLEVNTLLTNVRYEVEGSRVYFSSHFTLIDPGPTTLLFKLVVAFDEYATDDEVSIPRGGDIRMFDIVVELLRQIPPPDEIVDANTTQIET